jgi:hypothetical protein
VPWTPARVPTRDTRLTRPAHPNRPPRARQPQATDDQPPPANSLLTWSPPWNVGGHGYGSGMYTRWTGATGRYQGKCEQGHCAQTGGQVASKHQGEILTLLKYVIGNGRGDVSVFSGRRQFRVDMAFSLPNGRVLAAEYDGAYWHGGNTPEERQRNEDRDFHKARAIEDAWRDKGCVVVRIREDPLEPLYPHDIQVPARSDPGTCAKAALIHLVHVLHSDILGSLGEDRVFGFLQSAARPLTFGDLRCDECRQVASYFLPNEAFLAQPDPSAQPADVCTEDASLF